MPEGSKIGFDFVGLGKSVLTERMHVPPYQRSFSWDTEQAKDLLDDVAHAMETNQQEYFLGSIVTTAVKGPRPQVVDGQQRLATVVILLAAIRDYLYAGGFVPSWQYVERTYLQDEDPYTQDMTPMLELNADDADYFRKRILSRPDSVDRQVQATKPSHRRIDRVAALAKTRVADIANDPDPRAAVLRWEKFVKDSLKVAWVKAPDESDAYMIFETLNDRGLALALADLLKNYLFGLAGSARIEEVKQRWQGMVGTLEAIDGEKAEETLLSFIRHLWSSQHGVARTKLLYAEIKSKIRGAERALSFASELESKSLLYAAILNPAHEQWRGLPPKTKTHIKTLVDLKMVQIRPLLLSVLDKLPKGETPEALRLMVSWVVRFLISGGLGSGTLETYYSDAACDIYKGKIKTAKALATKMRKVVPSDSEFEAKFRTATVVKASLARYCLRTLESVLVGETQPEKVVNDDASDLNLEHILPLSPRGTWTHFSEDDQEEYAARIGNMVLLKEKINRKTGNAEFEVKKPHYAGCSLKLTAEVASEPKWDKEQIEQRQFRLAKIAVKAWPLD